VCPARVCARCLARSVDHIAVSGPPGARAALCCSTSVAMRFSMQKRAAALLLLVCGQVNIMPDGGVRTAARGGIAKLNRQHRAANMFLTSISNVLGQLCSRQASARCDSVRRAVPPIQRLTLCCLMPAVCVRR
jgi:hypothetical protein